LYWKINPHPSPSLRKEREMLAELSEVGLFFVLAVGIACGVAALQRWLRARLEAKNK